MGDAFIAFALPRWMTPLLVADALAWARANRAAALSLIAIVRRHHAFATYRQFLDVIERQILEDD